MEIKAKEIKIVPTSSLIKNPKNRNHHPQDQIERLAETYKYQGMRTPIVVSNQSGFIVAGNGRYLAAIRAGLKELPVSFQDFDSPEQEYAFGIADNGLGAWAELDLSAINTDLADLGPDFNLDMLGIKNFTLDMADKEGLTDPDEIPEVTESKAKLGDIYKLGEHRLMCGDSTSLEQVEKLMDGKKAKAWISDPPYGINHVETSQEKGQSKGYKKIANDDLHDEELKDFIFKSIEASKPYLEKGFAFYMWHAMKMQAYFSQAAAAAAGILFHRQIIWEKERFVFGRGHYHWQHELCLMGWLEGNEPPFYGERNQTTIWKVSRENDKIHPTQKPVELYEKPIKNHLKSGEIFIEPFGGSGVGIIAAEKCGVSCYCMELDPHYIDVIITRWEKFTGKTAEKING